MRKTYTDLLGYEVHHYEAIHSYSIRPRSSGHSFGATSAKLVSPCTSCLVDVLPIFLGFRVPSDAF